MTSISVIIPVWNRADTIRRAIDSVLAQKLPAEDCSVRVIVVDDGSTDDLPGALRRYDSRVTLIRHEHNAGAAAARNTGIAAADGELLAFLDSDDVWLPGKLVEQIGFMHEHGYAASCTACYLARVGAPDVVWPHYKSRSIVRSELLWGCYLSPGTTMLCEPRLFNEVGLFDTKLPRHEDWDWLLRLTARHKLGYLTSPLARREPSAYAKVDEVLYVLDRMVAKHFSSLSAGDRGRFKAALSFEAAAAYYRAGRWSQALRFLFKGMSTAPFGHAALRAAIAGRLHRN